MALLSEFRQYVTTLSSGYIGTVFSAIVIVILGFVIGRIVERLAYNLLKSVSFDDFIKKSFGIKGLFEQGISKFSMFIVCFIAIIMAINRLKIAFSLFSIILAVVFIILFLGISLVIKDFLPNAIAGMIIRKKHSFKVNDTIKVNSVEGKVKSISPIEVTVETVSGDIIYIPNTLIVKNDVKVLNV